MKSELMVMLLILAVSVTAQTSGEKRTLFGNRKPEIGYIATPSCQIGNFAGSIAVIPGIGAGVLLGNKYYLGLNYRFTATENTPAGGSNNNLYLDQRWGGMRLEYSLFPEKTFHLNFPVEIGLSHIENDMKESFRGVPDIPVSYGEATFGYIEPGVVVEINLMKFARLNFSVGYQFTSSVTFDNLTERDFRGFLYAVALKIGVY